MTAEDRLAALPHVRYEVEMLFFLPHFSGAKLIENAILESRLIHARSLNEFFSPKSNPHPRDVRPEHFGFPAGETEIKREIVDRFNRDLAHISYDRLNRTTDTKAWVAASLLPQLLRRSCKFAHHIIDTYGQRLGPGELCAWQALHKELERIREQSNGVVTQEPARCKGP